MTETVEEIKTTSEPQSPETASEHITSSESLKETTSNQTPEIIRSKDAESLDDEINAAVDEHMKNYETNIARSRLDYIYDSANQAAKDVIDRKKDTRPLGYGAQKVVYEYGDDNVIAFFGRSNNPERAEQMKREFYQRKLMHLLMPDNFPDIHLAGSQPGVMISEKINPGPDVKSRLEKYKRKLNQFKLKRSLKKIGVGVDSGSSANFILDDKGNEVYVDDPYLYPTKKMLKLINQLDEVQKQQAMRYISRAFPDYFQLNN